MEAQCSQVTPGCQLPSRLLEPKLQPSPDPSGSDRLSKTPHQGFTTLQKKCPTIPMTYPVPLGGLSLWKENVWGQHPPGGGRTEEDPEVTSQTPANPRHHTHPAALRPLGLSSWSRVPASSRNQPPERGCPGSQDCRGRDSIWLLSAFKKQSPLYAHSIQSP